VEAKAAIGAVADHKIAVECAEVRLERLERDAGQRVLVDLAQLALQALEVGLRDQGRGASA